MIIKIIIAIIGILRTTGRPKYAFVMPIRNGQDSVFVLVCVVFVCACACVCISVRPHKSRRDECARAHTQIRACMRVCLFHLACLFRLLRLFRFVCLHTNTRACVLVSFGLLVCSLVFLFCLCVCARRRERIPIMITLRVQ